MKNINLDPSVIGEKCRVCGYEYETGIINGNKHFLKGDEEFKEIKMVGKYTDYISDHYISSQEDINSKIEKTKVRLFGCPKCKSVFYN